MTKILEMDSEKIKTQFGTLEDMVETLLKQNRGSGGNLHFTECHNSSNDNTSPQLFEIRNIKPDFPCFDGSEVLQWIFKAKQFFDYYNTPDA